MVAERWWLDLFDKVMSLGKPRLVQVSRIFFLPSEGKCQEKNKKVTAVRIRNN